MRRFLAFCLLLLFSLTTVYATDPTPEETILQFAESMTKAAELLDTVKDEKTATDAKAKLDELATKQRELKAKLEKLPPASRTAVSAKALAGMGEAEQKMSLAHDRIFSKAKPAYKVLHGSKLFDAIEKPREKLAEQNASLLISGTQNMAAKNRGVYPKDLKMLVEKVEGRLPLIDGGVKSLIDPWGAPYQYEVSLRKFQNVELETPYVWTVSPYSGRKLGTPPPEKK